jgi:hypothetical protein
MPQRDPAVHLQHAFVRDGKLIALPSKPRMLQAACSFLVERFEPDRLYDEREVNAILADDAPDPATLRRLLVDHGLLGRTRNTYWRERPSPPPAPGRTGADPASAES